MPTASTSNSPNRADEPQNASAFDPRLKNLNGYDGESTYDEMQETKHDIKVDQEKVDVKPNGPTTWTMEQIEEFFITHGYKDEVEYVKNAELDTEKASKLGSEHVAPVTTFSLKMGLRVLELIKILKKLSEAPTTGSSGGGGGATSHSTSSWGDFGSSRSDNTKSDWSSGGGGSGSYSNFRSSGGDGGGDRSFSGGGGRGRGGGSDSGGGRACFKCNETGHFARECPTGGGGGGGGRGGGSRACFKCNEVGHISRDCPNGGGGGGGGGRYNSRPSNGGDSSFPSSWGGGDGGGGGRGGGGNNDSYDRPAKRPRQSDSYGGGNSYGSSAPAAQEDSWE